VRRNGAGNGKKVLARGPSISAQAVRRRGRVVKDCATQRTTCSRRWRRNYRRHHYRASAIGLSAFQWRWLSGRPCDG